MESKLKIFNLKALMKLPGFSGLRLHDQIFFDNGLNLFFRGNFSNIISDVN